MTTNTIDFTGARGSNAGDVFHELWAVREALRLIGAEADLHAIELEGIASKDGSQSEWDGVDCALFFGGESLETAERIELQQLKYSSANPTKNWTVSRLSVESGDPAKSVLRRLGTAFQKACKLRSDLDDQSISVSLITNQPISPELLSLVDEARVEVPTFKGAWSPGKSKLHRLVHASGLSSKNFKRFAKCLVIGEQSNSRFGLEEAVLVEISLWEDTEFSEIASRLRKFVRNQMLPEETGRPITRQSVLIQFGVSDERVLFPCPSKIVFPSNTVRRNLVEPLAAKLLRGTQKICLHGPGGVGKTTILEQLKQELPNGSELIVYDCYGGGNYMDASELRHRPKDAFMQLANELAIRLRLPAMLEPKSGRDFARAFRSRLDVASQSITLRDVSSLIVIVVDAADNAIHAARHREPLEGCFVSEIMSFGDLPSNVRLVISARTGRLDDLALPDVFEAFQLTPFNQEETRQFVRRKWDAPADWIEDFHHLSEGVARVQNYAFQQVDSKFKLALDYLRPNGKTLEEVFEVQFREAVTKYGSNVPVERICAGLVALPRPIPVEVLANVLGTPIAEVVDICSDLSPGIQSHSKMVGFADEDFEAFVRQKAKSQLPSVIATAATLFITKAEINEYAALHVAQLLYDAGETDKLLELVEDNPMPPDAVIGDPVRRQETYARRLLYALRACRKAGDVPRALRFVLIGAEGRRTEDATRELLISFPRLASRYAKESSGRMILGDPELREAHGPHLLQSLSVDAEKGDAVGVRETRRRLAAWFEVRKQNYLSQKEEGLSAHGWELSTSDFVSAVVARALADGVDSALVTLRNQRPFRFRNDIARLTIDRLLALQRIDLVEAALEKLPAWMAVYPSIRLSTMGCEVATDRLACGISQLLRRWPILRTQVTDYGHGNQQEYDFYVDMVLSAAEILVAKADDAEIAKLAFSSFITDEVRRLDNLHTSDTRRVDAILRSISLTSLIDGYEINTKQILIEPPELKETNSSTDNDNHRSSRHDNLKKLVALSAPFYLQRAKILYGGRHGTTEKIKQPKIGDKWRFNQQYEFRELQTLMADGLLVLGAAGVPKSDLLSWVLTSAKTLRADTHNAELVQKLTAFPTIHDELLTRLLIETDELDAERIGAEEKSNGLAKIAESLIPISTDESNAVFQRAIEVAAELDSESIGQLELLSALITESSEAFGKSNRVYALRASEITADAGIRVGDIGEFPWEASLRMIELLDLPIALACAARWHDEAIVHLRESLEPVIRSSLESGRLGTQQASALSVLLEAPSLEIFDALISSSKRDNCEEMLANELARDLMGERIPIYEILEPYILKHGQSSWARRYRESRGFQKSLPSPKPTEHYKASANSTQARWDPNSFTWERDDLIDTDRLEEASLRALEALRNIENYGSLEDVLKEARKHVRVADRVAHLDALMSISNRRDNNWLIGLLMNTAEKWSSHAVKNWSRHAFKTLLVNQIGAFCGRRVWGKERLQTAIKLSELSGADLQMVLLEAVEYSADYLDAQRVLELAETIASDLSKENVAQLSQWYIDRLFDRVAENDRENICESAVPISANEAVARFLAAYMSDVDLRFRWRATHAARRLARLGDEDSLNTLFACYPEKENLAFRAESAPYYWLATRLWILIAFDRIALERPDTIGIHFNSLLKIATDANFPHLLIRDYAARVCITLAQSDSITISIDHLEALNAVNEFLPPSKLPQEQQYGSSIYHNRENERFHFDSLDTLRYWYDPWVRIFENVSANQFAETAETWIIDRWGTAVEESHGWSVTVEKRRQRFGSPFDRFTSNSHGELPTIENYRMHLEWNAMWCAAGELASTENVTKENDADYGTVEWHLAHGRPTHPPYWLSDFAGPPPLQTHRWVKLFDEIEEWRSSIHDNEFVCELIPEDRKGWVVVAASISSWSQDWKNSSQVTSSLVSPAKAHALVRALQLIPNEHDFYLPHEDASLEIKTGPYSLVGWLASDDRDTRFDAKDPFRNDIDRLQRVPGKAVSRTFNLSRSLDDGLVWLSADQSNPAFRYEAWGRRNEDDWGKSEYLGDRVATSGYRLLVRQDILDEFLDQCEHDLIVELEITKHDRRSKQESYAKENDQKTVYDRIVLLRGDGNIETAESSLGTWKEDSG